MAAWSTALGCLVTRHVDLGSLFVSAPGNENDSSSGSCWMSSVCNSPKDPSLGRWEKSVVIDIKLVSYSASGGGSLQSFSQQESIPCHIGWWPSSEGYRLAHRKDMDMSISMKGFLLWLFFGSKPWTWPCSFLTPVPHPLFTSGSRPIRNEFLFLSTHSLQVSAVPSMNFNYWPCSAFSAGHQSYCSVSIPDWLNALVCDSCGQIPSWFSPFHPVLAFHHSRTHLLALFR